MTPDDRERDERMSRLLAATRADADPALWTRVRARIEARERVPGWIAWTTRPAALAASVALLVAASGLSWLLAGERPSATGSESDSLIEALFADRGIEAVAPIDLATPEPQAPGDSGSAR